jgi:hypothetical protein
LVFLSRLTFNNAARNTRPNAKTAAKPFIFTVAADPARKKVKAALPAFMFSRHLQQSNVAAKTRRA